MLRLRSLESRLLAPAILLSSVALVRCASDDDDDAGPAGKAGSAGASATGGGGRGGSGGSRAQAGSGNGSGGRGGIAGGGTGGTVGSGGTNAGASGTPSGGQGGEGGEGGDAGDAGDAGAGGEIDAGGAAGHAGDGGASAGESGAGGETNEPSEAILGSILVGSFAPLPAYAGEDISGQALLVRTLAGETQLSLQLSGLAASTAYPAHVHALPCEFAAGGHYKIDPTNTATEETNEIWAPFTTDAAGIGSTAVVAQHLARGDALSVVVHDPNAGGTPKMACADLSLGFGGELRASGTLSSFPLAEVIDQTIAGEVELVRTSSGTSVTLAVSGLDAGSSYSSHVHALPCPVNTAGGHYKLDPLVTDTLEANELWPALGDTSDGAVDGTSSFAHRARLDAQSVVIHRSASGATPKVACANLLVENYPNLTQTGSAVLLPGATAYPNLTAQAKLERRLDGTTSVYLQVAGLAAHEIYPVHVHNLPCALQSGGGHYLRDTAAPASEDNEIWAPVEAGHDGSAEKQVSVAHVARADARSLVIHDFMDSTRLACIDLETTP